MSLTVRDVMTGPAPTIPYNASAADAERLLLKGGLTELFVTDEDGFVIGVLPDYVFLKVRLSDGEAPRGIADLLSRRFFVIGPDTPLIVAARYLRDHLHHRLAVVEHRRLIGLVTRTAVLSTLVAADDAGGAAA